MAEQKAALLALEELGVMEPKEVDEAIEQIAESEEVSTPAPAQLEQVEDVDVAPDAPVVDPAVKPKLLKRVKKSVKKKQPAV
jgi:hypothetical protein